MSKEIKVAVISSLITSVILFAVANMMGLFKAKIEDAQISTLASNIVDSNTDALLKHMSEAGTFVGPQGIQGIKGDTGDQGPEWNPTVSTENIYGNTPQTISLGDHKLCFLNRAGSSHATNSCVCTVARRSNLNDWSLRLQADPRVTDTRCNCGSICID